MFFHLKNHTFFKKEKLPEGSF